MHLPAANAGRKLSPLLEPAKEESGPPSGGGPPPDPRKGGQGPYHPPQYKRASHTSPPSILSPPPASTTHQGSMGNPLVLRSLGGQGVGGFMRKNTQTSKKDQCAFKNMHIHSRGEDMVCPCQRTTPEGSSAIVGVCQGKGGGGSRSLRTSGGGGSVLNKYIK